MYASRPSSLLQFGQAYDRVFLPLTPASCHAFLLRRHVHFVLSHLYRFVYFLFRLLARITRKPVVFTRMYINIVFNAGLLST
jgi:hypothetical protein